jgi:hypothetical protein
MIFWIAWSIDLVVALGWLCVGAGVFLGDGTWDSWWGPVAMIGSVVLLWGIVIAGAMLRNTAYRWISSGLVALPCTGLLVFVVYLWSHQSQLVNFH